MYSNNFSGSQLHGCSWPNTATRSCKNWLAAERNNIITRVQNTQIHKNMHARAHTDTHTHVRDSQSHTPPSNHTHTPNHPHPPTYTHTQPPTPQCFLKFLGRVAFSVLNATQGALAKIVCSASLSKNCGLLYNFYKNGLLYKVVLIQMEKGFA